ncbi:MAG: hypothetical protein HQL97_09050 [Magnetococcales bacterium]|nr:hypothetical protein [Magnetococcales bacterium]
MTTIEMRPTGKGPFGNGLIARGFARRTIRRGSVPETAGRDWSFGLGMGISGMTGFTGWIHMDCSMAGNDS